VVYKATDYYSPEDERSLLWDAQDINIQWPSLIKEKLILSPKDALGKTLKEAEVFA